HVDAFPTESGDNPANINSHFLRFTWRAAEYIRIARKAGSALALSIAAGYNLQLTGGSATYPDRLFFLGGVDSLRAFLAGSVVPEDVAQCILSGKQCSGNKRVTLDDVAIRGGNVVLNPRAELRIPITDVVQTGIFLDAGNVWVDPANVNLLAI